jgi:Fe-S cluster biosynthesis and repair protein YggX
MPTIACTRCGREGPILEKPPFKDELGREVQEHTCADCWKEWLQYQVKLINELSLLPVNPEHGAILEKNLRAFLRLPSAGDGSVDEVGAPPAS